MKRLQQFFRDSLDLSIAEARSAIVLFSLIFLVLLLTIVATRLLEKKAGEIVITEFGHLQLPEKKTKRQFSPYPGKDKGSTYKTAVKHFPFDPNTASEEELKTLGIAFAQVRMILNYRSKGGKFRFREDLKKIYGFRPEYLSLEGYIRLPSKSDESRNQPFFRKDSVTKAGRIKQKPFTEITRFDLNTADTSQLIRLKGIGSVLAGRIVKFRDMLGGFVSVEQVSETYGVSPEAMAEILKFAYIQTPHRKISINAVAPDKLRHPYLKSFQVRAIITYRNQHGRFASIEDLKNIRILDESVIEKIRPYLAFD